MVSELLCMLITCMAESYNSLLFNTFFIVEYQFEGGKGICVWSSLPRVSFMRFLAKFAP